MIERMYIGSYSDNIKVCEFCDGKIKVIDIVKGLVNPSYLHVNDNILYSVSESMTGSITVFKIEKHTLKIVNTKQIGQKLPCYITTDRERKNLLIANYESGSILKYQLEENGTIGKEKYKKTVNKSSHMHYVKFVENNIFAVDLGNDIIYIYNSEMELISSIKLDKGSGPRHFAMSKDNKKIYIITELSNEIHVYEKCNNKYKLIQKVSTLVNKNVQSFAGAIKISSNNKNIYVTNRGDNSISVFEITKDNIELIQNISSYGDFPRDIVLNNSEEYAVVTNQKSNNVAIYIRDIENGLLKIEDANLKIEKPSCVVRSNYEI